MMRSDKSFRRNKRIKWGIVLTAMMYSFIAVDALAAPILERPDSVIKKAVSDLSGASSVDPENFAFMITDIATGEVVAEYEADRALVPASILKSVSTATLLSDKGPEWRYETDVFTVGKIQDGVLQGNLLVVGSGDPTLNSRNEPKSTDFLSEIADALRKKDIDSISGKILIDQSVFQGPSQPSTWGSGDLSRDYGTGSHGFNFDNNTRGGSAVKDPSAVFLTRLLSKLHSAKIKVGDNNIEADRRKLLIRHKSAPLEDIMRSCMMRSDNLFAECILRTYSAQRGGDGSTTDAAEREMDYWRKKHASMQGVKIIDGSGLSRSNKVTSRFITDVLRKMSDNVEYVSFFPLAGQEGTLRRFMTGTRLDSYLAMKTGSMRGIQCYAGYLLDDDFAPTHTIVVICNNMPDRGAFRKDLSEFFLTVF
ncbi:MAG: D-alanyl-D-alanine carboxypeptidase [Muribaculum sp.]|nr:D-alanyl-D-alanine carboxypeptidase [Muribaculum sp.]